MNVEKDYYFILGVLPTAEDAVIRAAYKALSQKYHPDKNLENKEFAQQKMSDINEAYAVLSDNVKRKEYDEAREAYVSDFDAYSTESNDFQDEGYDPFENDWKFAVKYQPDLLLYEKKLTKVSKKLAFTFKAFLLATKRFDQTKSIAEFFEAEFLKIYFGENPEIIKFARRLIAKGDRDAARELNKVIKVFGDSAVPEEVIRQISREFRSKTSEDGICPKCMYLSSPFAPSCRRCGYVFSAAQH